jgi:hypothetical protein
VTISGLVVTLSDDPGRCVPALEAIRRADPFTLGEQFGPRLPLALEAADASASDRWHDWLTHLDGVVKVDVAFVSFDPDEGRDHV